MEKRDKCWAVTVVRRAFLGLLLAAGAAALQLPPDMQADRYAQGHDAVAWNDAPVAGARWESSGSVSRRRANWRA